MSELMALDGKEYRAWIGELKKRYRATQIKAAVAVNSAMIEFYRECRKHGCPKPQYSVNPGEPGDIMVRVDAAPDAIVESSENKCETISGPINDAINDAISEAINEAIKRTPGINKPKLVKLLGKSKATVERAISELIASSRIEHRGSKKTGGYFLKG